MHTLLMAEFARARSEELQRRAALVRMARAADARQPRRRPRIRRRVDLSAALDPIARRFTRGASRKRLGAEPAGADLIGSGRAQR